MTSKKFKEFIQTTNTFVFVGNGGTGKTTLSAAWAMEMAKTGKKVGLLTIDPSKRLGDVFSMNLLEESFKSISLGAGSLDVYLMDSKQIIKDFVIKNFSDTKWQQLQKSKIFQQISSVLAENQSLSTIYKLNELLQSQKYDVFVVDTPPSNNSMDFFTTPDFVIRIFKENILARASLEAKSFRFFSSKKIFSNVFTFLVGEDFYREVENFFQILLLFQEQIVSASQDLRMLFEDQKTRFILVTLPDAAKIQEILTVAKGLFAQNIIAEYIFINRAYPDWLDLSKKSDVYRSQDVEIQNYYDKAFNYYNNQTRIARQLALDLNDKMKVYFVPEKTLELETEGVDGFSRHILAIFEDQ